MSTSGTVVEPFSAEDVEATSLRTPMGRDYRRTIAAQLFSPALLGERDLPHCLDLAVGLGIFLDPLIKEGWSYGKHRLGHPQRILLRDGQARDDRMGSFSAEFEVDGDSSPLILELKAEEVFRWRTRITGVVWPDDTLFGLVFIPDLITAWSMDLGPLAPHRRVLGSKGSLLLKRGKAGRRRQQLREIGEREWVAWDGRPTGPLGNRDELRQLLMATELDELRKFDPLMKGIVVRDGVFEPGRRPYPDLSSEQVRYKVVKENYQFFDRLLSSGHGRCGKLVADHVGADSPVAEDPSRGSRSEDLLELLTRRHDLITLMDRTALTRRERQVIDLCRRGEPNQAIAQMLGITPSAVTAHKSNAVRKLRARA